MDLSAIAKIVTILAVAGSFVYACLRVGMVAGKTDGRLSSLTDGLSELAQSLRAFVDRAEDRFTNHSERLAALEAHRRSSGHD
jgi:hypothetical protein